jgi:glycosyltransferase involved in cell wall biosynthesis
LKIALVAPRFAPDIGGVETHVRELATRFANRGMCVEVLTQTSNRSLPSEHKLGDVIVRRFPVAFRSDNYAVSWQLPLFIAHNRRHYDLIHVHSYHALPALGGALLAGDRPVVFTPHYHGVGHSPFRNYLHRPYRLLGRLLFRRSDRVICVSHAEASLVAGHFPEVVSKIEVIPNGVDTSDLTAAVPFEIRERVVLSVGRLERYKNVDAVISAIRELDESYVLRIVGEGPDGVRLRRQVNALGLRSRVEFLGRVDRASLCRWYRTASVYVSVSSQEAFGISALEALASGAAIVLSDIPAHREILERYAGDRGRVVRRPLGPSHLAEVIKAAALGQREAAPTVALPSWDAVAAETADLYASTIRSTLRRGLGEEREIA